MDKSTQVAVIGTGTMGSGIAQLAAMAGHTTYLFDTRKEAVVRAQMGLRKTFDRLVEKGRMTFDESIAVRERIVSATLMKDFADCGLVIEAIVEDLAVKKKLFADVEAKVEATAVLATNTSSLSVTAIASACTRPGRVLGLHFFNPAPLLPLVEVVPGIATDPRFVTDVSTLMAGWKKVPVICKDTPGFIVNRVARPFYGESLRIFEEGIADKATIDRAMKEVGGFKMGPFELMDLIGNDINFAVTRIVWESFFYDPRYKPSFTQQRMVEAGWLGRKTGRGYYSYDEQGQVVAAAQSAMATIEKASMIVDRVVAMLINEAVDALHLGIASRDDIDTAMTKGVNYPKGLLKWADEKGLANVLALLESLQTEYGEDRYRPSPLLRRMVREGQAFY